MTIESPSKCLPKESAQDVKNPPLVRLSAQDVNRSLVKGVDKALLTKRGQLRKRLPRVPQTFTRLECFTREEWEEYRAHYARWREITGRRDTIESEACLDCTLSFQTTNILYGTCWPTNLRLTPLGREYHGEVEESE